MKVSAIVSDQEHARITEIARKRGSTVGAVVGHALKRFLADVHKYPRVATRGLESDGRKRER